MDFDFAHPKSLFAQYFTTELCTEKVLTENEKSIVKGFSGKRLEHFSTGRFCAKKALDQLGNSNYDILIGANREPLWPEGFIGSISHTDKLVGAVAAKSSDLTSIGLDIEKTGRVKPDMWKTVFTPAEQEFLLSLSEEGQELYSTLYFSMKESFYKLQHPITKTYLWFKDVEIESYGEQFRLSVKKEFAGKELLPETTDLYFAKYQDLVISICFME